MTPDIDAAAKPVSISVGVSPMLDRVVIDIEGQTPVGLTLEDGLAYMAQLSDVLQRMIDARKARPQ